MIKIQTIDVEMPTMVLSEIRCWLERLTASHGRSVGELYYIFCSDDYLFRMNEEKLGHHFLTDIITFPLNECENILSSEFYISLDRIRDNAKIFERSFDDELHRVMAHGLLHLCGFDDLTEEESAEMRKQEDIALMMLYS